MLGMWYFKTLAWIYSSTIDSSPTCLQLHCRDCDDLSKKMFRCYRCDELKPHNNFSNEQLSSNLFRCYSCPLLESFVKSETALRSRRLTTNQDYHCCICGKTKSYNEFSHSQRRKLNGLHKCRECLDKGTAMKCRKCGWVFLADQFVRGVCRFCRAWKLTGLFFN